MIQVLGTWNPVDGLRMPPAIVAAKKVENLLEAAEVAERNDDFKARDEILQKAIAWDIMSHRRRLTA